MKTILKFSAPWCGPCQQYKPVFDSWINWQTEVHATNIDIDATPWEGSKYRVMSVPTTILLDENWNEINRHIWPMSEGELNTFVNV